MIECIFTLDYEIYGNGEGTLRELVYEPAERLRAIFHQLNAHFVLFVEAAELEMIELEESDNSIHLVKQQIREFYEEGIEIGLHLHPQWYNAIFKNGKWLLDYNEYNLCILPPERIYQFIRRGIKYLQNVLGIADFIPLSFRAGNWLLQPTLNISKALTEQGLKVDSSVYKGGLQHVYKLDYRSSLKNGLYWKFSDDVNVSDPLGALTEFPIHTIMVPIWKVLSAKRVGLQLKSHVGSKTSGKRFLRLLDFLRLKYPLKLDFCRMTLNELTNIFFSEIENEKKNPGIWRPIIAIGHTKDLKDLETVESLLSYLDKQEIVISTFMDIYKPQLQNLRQ